MRKDNRGFSLIELIVVIAIIAIMAIGATVGLNTIGFGKAKNAVGKIDAALQYVQIENMSKSKNYIMVIEPEGSDYSLSIMEKSPTVDKVVSKEKLNMGGGEISVTYANDSTQYHIGVAGVNPIGKLEVSFRKDTGGVIADGAGKFVSTIGVTAANRSYTIQLVQTTGKHYIR